MKSVLAWMFLPCLALAFYCGAKIGDEVKQHPGAEELKLTVHNLEAHSSEMSPQLREYLKARSYTLLIGGIRSGWVNDRVDYGPIDRKILGPVAVVKGAESDDDLYRLAMDAAGIKPAEQDAAGQSATAE